MQTGTYPVTSEIAQFYGAQSLKPAKATNYGLGFVFTPSNNMTLTVDAYSIKVRDRIFISQEFEVTAADIVALPDLAAVGVGGVVQYFTTRSIPGPEASTSSVLTGPAWPMVTST